MILTCSFRGVLFPSPFSKNPIISLAAYFRIIHRATKKSILVHRRLNSTRSLSQMDHTDSSVSGSECQPPVYAWNEDVESLEDYRPGGYHPVHIGDTLSAGRYEVIHKLGHGSYSTVWLCKDIPQQRYVSIKVIVSECDPAEQPRYENIILEALRNGDPSHPGRKFVIDLLDDFIVDGPNGHHQCLVFPVALSSVVKPAGDSDHFLFPPQVARSIATQALLALSYIHSCGIIHGGMLTKYTSACLLTTDSVQIYTLKTSFSKRHLQVYGHFQSPMRKLDTKGNYQLNDLMVRLLEPTFQNTKSRLQASTVPTVAPLLIPKFLS